MGHANVGNILNIKIACHKKEERNKELLTGLTDLEKAYDIIPVS